jgi:hypothetical protein
MSAKMILEWFQVAAISIINDWNGRPGQDDPNSHFFRPNHFVPFAAKYFGVNPSTIRRALANYKKYPQHAADIANNPDLAAQRDRCLEELRAYYAQQKEYNIDSWKRRIVNIVCKFDPEMWQALCELQDDLQDEFQHTCKFLNNIARQLGLSSKVFMEALERFRSQEDPLQIADGDIDADMADRFNADKLDPAKVKKFKVALAEAAGAKLLAKFLAGKGPFEQSVPATNSQPSGNATGGDNGNGEAKASAAKVLVTNDVD